jgi:large-conductance mechanosensitive channel
MGLRAFWAEFKTFAFKGNMIDLAVAVVIGAAFSGVINSLVSDIIMPGIIYLTTTASKAADVAAETAKNAGSALGIATSQPAATQPTTVPAATPEQQAAATALLAIAANDLDASQTPLSKADDDVKALQAMKASLPPDLQGKIDDAVKRLDAAKAAAAPTAAPAPPPAPPPAQPKAVDFDWKVGPFKVGSFVGALINFVLIALAVFVTIVKLLGTVMKRMGPKPGPTEPVTKECPFCLSIIPIKAKKCAHCTADIPVPATPATT